MATSLPRNILYCMLLAVFFLPDLRLTSSFAARPEDILVLLVFFYALFSKELYAGFFNHMMVVFAVIMFISIGGNFRLLSVNSFEFYNKIVKGGLVYSIALQTLLDEKSFKEVGRFLSLCIVAVVVFNLLQMLNLPPLRPLYAVFSTAQQISAFDKVAMSSIPRLTGLLGNPNTNSILSLMLFGFALDMFLLTRKSFYLMCILGLALVVLFCQSRTTMGAMMIVAGVALLATANLNLLLPVVFGYILINVLDVEYLKTILNPEQLSQSHSATRRIEIWEDLLGMIKKQPFLGFGGYKEYFYQSGTYAESEYVLGWFRYGIFYVLAYGVLLLRYLLVGLLNLRKGIPGPYFMVASCIAFLMGSVSNAPYNHPRLFVLFAVICAYLDASITNSNYPDSENRSEVDSTPVTP